MTTQGDGFSAFSAQILAEGSERDSLALSEFGPAAYVVPQDAIFRREIIDIQTKLLIDFSRHPSQQLVPAHAVSVSLRKVAE